MQVIHGEQTFFFFLVGHRLCILLSGGGLIDAREKRGKVKRQEKRDAIVSAAYRDNG